MTEIKKVKDSPNSPIVLWDSNQIKTTNQISISNQQTCTLLDINSEQWELVDKRRYYENLESLFASFHQNFHTLNHLDVFDKETCSQLQDNLMHQADMLPEEIRATIQYWIMMYIWKFQEAHLYKQEFLQDRLGFLRKYNIIKNRKIVRYNSMNTEFCPTLPENFESKINYEFEWASLVIYIPVINSDPHVGWESIYNGSLILVFWKKGTQESEKTKKHELQHATNHLFMSNFETDDFDLSKQYDNVNDRNFWWEMNYLLHDGLQGGVDEILAYLSGWDSPELIKNHLVNDIIYDSRIPFQKQKHWTQPYDYFFKDIFNSSNEAEVPLSFFLNYHKKITDNDRQNIYWTIIKKYKEIITEKIQVAYDLVTKYNVSLEILAVTPISKWEWLATIYKK